MRIRRSPHALARVAAICVWMAAGSALAQSAEELPLPTDPRVIEANSLLSDPERLDVAIDLYRSALTDAPDDFASRRWLARVLSWRGEYDESLAEYGVIQRAYVRTMVADHPPFPRRDLDLEIAEVLSWAGRYDDAEEAFSRLLAADPEDSRALRGLARVYSWSGRRHDAEKTYRASLASEEDAEVRAELERLESAPRGEAARGVKLRGETFQDSDDFERSTITADTKLKIVDRTDLVVSGGWTRIRRGSDAPSPGPSPANADDLFQADREQDAGTVRLGVEQAFTEAITGRLEAGYEVWSDAPDQVLGLAHIEATLPSETAVALQWETGGLLSRTDGFDAVVNGTRQHSLRAQAWQGLGEHFGLFGYVETGFFSDDNVRTSGGLSADFVPVPELDASLFVGLDIVSYRDDAPAYYTPEADLGFSVGGRANLPIARWLRLEANASIGGGRTWEDDKSALGFQYTVRGGLTFLYRALSLTLSAGHGQSQRAIDYTTTTYGAALGVGF